MRLLIAVILFVCVVAYEAKKHENVSFNKKLHGMRMLAANPLPGRCKRQIDLEQCQSTAVKGFYYDLNADKCREYDGSGCLKFEWNGNSFKIFEDCVQVCDPREKRCDNNPSESNCGSLSRRIYYDKSEKICKKYPGDRCLGRRENDNSFETELDCEKACERNADPKPNTNSCLKPKKEISCSLVSTRKRFYYDATTKKCERNNTPGSRCVDGDNSFSTEEDCNRLCKSLSQSSGCDKVITNRNECAKVKNNWFYKNEECIRTILTEETVECGGEGNSFDGLNDLLGLRACEEKCVIVK